MKKICFAFCAFIMLFALLISPAQAATLVDDFNDGNLDGWVALGSHKVRSDFGNWRIESGVLINDAGGDGYITLLDNFFFTSQIVETQIKLIGPAGYAGILIWFQDYNNFIYFGASPGPGGLWVSDWANGVESNYLYPYPFNYNDNLWYHLKVESDHISGNIKVFIDGAYAFTYQATTPNRTGRTGFMNGNSGSFFDNFKLLSNDAPPYIDIKPGDNLNSVNLKGKSVAVAILSSPSFSATTQVNQTTLTFGKLGSEQSLLSCSRKGKDVNGDGLTDLVCSFSTVLTGFQCGNTEGILIGKMISSGILFEEKQIITVVPCK